jgi:hypothetical protein
LEKEVLHTRRVGSGLARLEVTARLDVGEKSEEDDEENEDEKIEIQIVEKEGDGEEKRSEQEVCWMEGGS